MLKYLHIRGFKSIRNENLSFGRVNLFIGGNGAGKSNVLEALGVFSAGLKSITDEELQKRGVRLSVPTLFKSAFKETTIRATLDLTGEFDNEVQYELHIKAGAAIEGLRFFSESILGDGHKIMGRSPNGVTVQGVSATKKDLDPYRGLWDRFRETVDVSEDVRAELERMSAFAIFAPQTAFLRGEEVETTFVQPMGLKGGGLAQAVQAVVQYAALPMNAGRRRVLINQALLVSGEPGWSSRIEVGFDPSVTSREVKTGTSSLYFLDRFMVKGRNKLSAYDSSEGTLYLLFIAVLLVHPRAPRILALDNIDNALNPAITRKLLDLIIASACSKEFRDEHIGPDQVFMTSHNPTSLDALDIFNEDHRIFIVRRDSNGSTSVKPLRPNEGDTRADWVRKSHGKKLSEMWIQGLIPGALGL